MHSSMTRPGTGFTVESAPLLQSTQSNAFIVSPRLQEIIQTLYGPFFKIIGFFYRIYTHNRARMKALKTREQISAFIKAAAVITLFVWIAIWFFASEESRNKLTEEFKQTIGEFESVTGK